MYDINVAIKSVQEYICHILRDVQQRKAKEWCMENLDDETAFWLKDFCQKILPTQFREGQQNYFGKKGMSLHVDVFFKKEGGQLKKRVYFTALQRCDQGADDVLCLADEILAEYKKDESSIKSFDVKSDNASCYHGNFCAKVEGGKVTNISSYHSIVFKDDHMVFWRYFDIGRGVTQKYTDVSFTSGIEAISSYTSTQHTNINMGKKIKEPKPRESRSLCKLLFCP